MVWPQGSKLWCVMTEELYMDAHALQKTKPRRVQGSSLWRGICGGIVRRGACACMIHAMPPPPRPEPVLCVFFMFSCHLGERLEAHASACKCMRMQVYALQSVCAAKCRRLHKHARESRACDCMSESSAPRPDPVFCVFVFGACACMSHAMRPPPRSEHVLCVCVCVCVCLCTFTHIYIHTL